MVSDEAWEYQCRPVLAGYEGIVEEAPLPRLPPQMTRSEGRGLTACCRPAVPSERHLPGRRSGDRAGEVSGVDRVFIKGNTARALEITDESPTRE
ncbi:Protein of unknown function [Gryllus bimaculatus]|nr:Protein of unknown function [Gryllus bimaculatus]